MKKLMFLFLMALVLAGGMAAFRMRLKEDRDFNSVLRRVIFQTRWFRMTAGFLALGITCIFAYCYQLDKAETASVLVTLNYAEAYKGQNTNGSRYNMSEIISDEVIERAIDKGAFENVTVSQLADCLSVVPVVQGDSFSEDGYHIATEFGVTFTQDKNTEHLNSENVVQMIGYAYKEFYIETYVDDYRALDISIDCEKDFADMDYMDIRQALGLEADRIANYMYGLADKNSSFASSDGETFLSLAGKCTNLKNVLIEDDFVSYLLQNGVSKNTREYIARLNYDNTRYDYECRKATASFEVRNEAVALYAEEMTRIVLVPTWDTEGEYYMGRTKVGVDTLSTEAESYSQKAARYMNTMETNRSVMEAMQASGRMGTDAYAETMTETISSEIMALALAAYRAGQEYSETRMNQCISVSVQREGFIKFAVFCGAYFMLSYLSICVLLQKRSMRKRRN